MAPEVEWDVDTSTGSQTIVKTPPPRSPSPRNRIIVLLVIVFGVTLGVIYRSIPEPPKPPTPTIRPTPTIAVSIDRVIDQEARALEHGDPQVFMRLQDPADLQWRTQQINSFKKWGEPPDYSDLYTIVISGMLGSDLVWADINQARDGQFFRETRFYRLVNDHWLRTAPMMADSFWGEQRTRHTPHFDLIYRARDEAGVKLIATQVEEFYTRVCADLECETVSASFDQRLTLMILPDIDTATVLGGTGASIPITYVLRSPSLAGLYFQDPAAQKPIENQISNVAIYGYIESMLPASIAFTAAGNAGNPDRWQTAQNGTALVGLISNWEQARIQPNQASYDDTYWRNVLTTTSARLPLEELWAWTPTYSQSLSDLYYAESTALIKFLDEQYTAKTVIQFLHAIAPAASLQNAIESMGLTYQDFEKDWQVWLSKNFPK